MARCASRINGFTDFFPTKLDVLTGIEEIPVCVAYEVDGVRHDEMPMTQTEFHHAKPVFENFPGWTEDISGARTLEDLPENARNYVLALEKLGGCRNAGPPPELGALRRPHSGAPRPPLPWWAIILSTAVLAQIMHLWRTKAKQAAASEMNKVNRH